MRALSLTAVLAAVAFLAVGGAAAAPADPPRPWTGVWAGTVGGEPVRACFGTMDPDQGAYYYLRHLRLLTLDPVDAAKAGGPGQAWTETDPAPPRKVAHPKDSPQWRLSPAPGGALAGAWSQGGRTLPVRLTPVAYAADGNPTTPCGALAFSAPRFIPPTLVRRPAVLDGVRYTQLAWDVGAHFGADLKSFALPPVTPGAARVNAQIAIPRPRLGGKALPGYLDCAMGAVGDFGQDGEYSDTLAPDLITGRWLVTDHVVSVSCGGAHPDAEETYKVWSLTAGKPVDPMTWFRPAALSPPAPKSYDPPAIGPGLRKLLVAHWTRDDEDCKDIAGDQAEWSIHPTREGLAFFPQLPHVVFACSDDDVIPYRDLSPLLNETGRAAIASIVEDLKSLPPKAKSQTYVAFH